MHRCTIIHKTVFERFLSLSYPTYCTAEPLSPTNLNITIDGTNLIVSWTEPFSFKGEELSFVVSAMNMATSTTEEFTVSNTSFEFTGPDGPRNCEEYNFTVFAENDFSRSRSCVSRKQTIPTGSAICMGMNIEYIRLCMVIYKLKIHACTIFTLY